MSAQSTPPTHTGAHAPAVDALCDTVRDRLRSGGALGSDLSAHASGCSVCGILVGLGLGRGADDPPLPPDALLHPPALAQEVGLRARLRELSTPTRVALAAALAALVPLLWLLASRRADLGVYPTARLSLDLALLLAPAALLFPLLLRPLHRRAVPTWVGPMLVFTAIATTLVLTSLPAAHWDHPLSRLGIGDDLAPRALACFLTGAASGGPVLVGVWLLSRSGESLRHLGALVAVFSGLVGGLAIFLHCPLTSPTHLHIGHATVMLPFLAIAMLGRGRA